MILNETIGKLDEIKIITEIAGTIQKPSIISLLFNDDGKLLDGTSIKDVILEITNKKTINCISFNCHQIKA
jgi:S-methylmethionine-dependent homocysteine/selenocysteine methylase